MTYVTEAGAGFSGASVLDGLKARTLRAGKVVWNAIVRAQEARAQRALANARKGIYVW